MSIRLNKYIAAAGLCSRREADRLIAEGRVTVNGQVAGMGMPVTETDLVTVNGKAVQSAPAKVVLAYYKPVGITCTARDRHADLALGEVFRYPVRVTYAGRLDKDSEGLLLMTNDGLLIERMMSGSQGHEKEYVVRLDKKINEAFVKKMITGVFLEDLNITTRPCKVMAEGEYSIRIILTQGVNRQIKRMCKELGFQVKSLKRVRVLNIRLADLQPGEYRRVTGHELDTLYHSCGLSYQEKT